MSWAVPLVLSAYAEWLARSLDRDSTSSLAALCGVEVALCTAPALHRARGRTASCWLLAAAPADGCVRGLGVWPAGNMFAGGIAGMTVEATLFPLDTLKTRLQTRVKGQPISFKGMYRGVPGTTYPMTSTPLPCRQSCRCCGAASEDACAERALLSSSSDSYARRWMVVTAATLAAFPASALFFGVYEPIKKKLEKTVPEGYSIVAHLGAAAAAGFAASLLRVPAEVVKQRMQTGEFKSMMGAISGVVKQQGIRRGLFAGYGSFMLRDLPFDVIEFVACVHSPTPRALHPCIPSSRSQSHRTD